MTKVVFTQPAEYDLTDIEYYIFFELENPQASDRTVDGIVETIKSLTTFPTGYPLVRDTLLINVGVRMTYFENYNIFYSYNEREDVIYIIRILYNRADWQNILHK